MSEVGRSKIEEMGGGGWLVAEGGGRRRGGRRKGWSKNGGLSKKGAVEEERRRRGLDSYFELVVYFDSICLSVEIIVFVLIIILF